MTAEDAPAPATADTGIAPREPDAAAGGPDPATGEPDADAAMSAVPDDDATDDDATDDDATDDDATDDDAAGASAWRIVSVVDVRMDLPAANPEVVLQETDAPWREVGIPVGLAEGTAIAYALRGVETARPLTHALVTEVLERQGVALEAARITGRQGRLFAAEVETAGPRGRQVVQCRPSDAIALVLRQRLPTPLLCGEWVFDNADGEEAPPG
jgi:bifunctional DNase/RNase